MRQSSSVAVHKVSYVTITVTRMMLINLPFCIMRYCHSNCGCKTTGNGMIDVLRMSFWGPQGHGDEDEDLARAIAASLADVSPPGGPSSSAAQHRAPSAPVNPPTSGLAEGVR